MKRVKNIAFIIIILLLFLPMIQKSISLFVVAPLKGSFTTTTKPEFYFKDYFSGLYQDQYNSYFEENIGFRPFLVRLNNQIAFSFFNITQANQVVIGKQNYLFEENYIKAYTGSDFQGSTVWDKKMEKLKFIADELQKMDIPLIVVFAPGKATYFPEFIPKKYNPEVRDTTNYNYLLDACKRLGIHHIDFNNYFVMMKDTVSYPLYPQCGIHWSYYGAGVAQDSIINYMENIKGKRMVDFGWSDVVVSSDLRDPDYDIAEGMNLLYKIKTFDMPYPQFYFLEDSATYKPSVITIADSYYWIYHGKGITQRIYENDNFWYYYEQMHGDRYKENRNLKEIDRLEEIESADFVVIMFTDANLYKFASGFIDDIFELLSNPDRQSEEQIINEELIKFKMKVIKNNKKWYNVIKEKAGEQNISIEEMLRRDATWLVNKELNK